jgi:hypothetical protein
MPPRVPPTVLLTNATIATGNPSRPWATALALDGNTLMAVGSAAELKKLAGPATRVIDAGGATLALPPGTAPGSPLTLVLTDDGQVTEIVSGVTRDE